MKKSIKHTVILTILFGLIFSVSLITISHITKIFKNDVIELTDIEDDFEDNEDDNESKKIELEDDFLHSEFMYAFASLNNIQHLFYTKSNNKHYNPYYSISTPPPKC